MAHMGGSSWVHRRLLMGLTKVPVRDPPILEKYKCTLGMDATR